MPQGNICLILTRECLPDEASSPTVQVGTESGGILDILVGKRKDKHSCVSVTLQMPTRNFTEPNRVELTTKIDTPCHEIVMGQRIRK